MSIFFNLFNNETKALSRKLWTSCDKMKIELKLTLFLLEHKLHDSFFIFGLNRNP